jgi:hypothetical protein
VGHGLTHVEPITDFDGGHAMTSKLPDWTTDWKAAFFAVERRLSPPLERLVRTDAFLDALTVWNSLSRLAGRSVGGVRTAIAASVGLPTTRQIADLQRSVDRLSELQHSNAGEQQAGGLS